jgi:hypothetical protein
MRTAPVPPGLGDALFGQCHDETGVYQAPCGGLAPPAPALGLLVRLLADVQSLQASAYLG